MSLNDQSENSRLRNTQHGKSGVAVEELGTTQVKAAKTAV